MKILAVEFSTEERSAAVIDNGVVRGQACVRGGRQVLGLVETVLKEASWEREEIARLAIGIGPGSYHGIRGAIAFAQGWQLALGTPAMAIGAAECVAAQAQARGIFGPCAVVIDAQRNEFYLARFHLTAEKIGVLAPVRLASHAEIVQSQKDGESLIGPELGAIFPGAIALFPEAGRVGLLAEGRTDFTPGENLEPIYLRETNFKKAPPSRLLPKI